MSEKRKQEVINKIRRIRVKNSQNTIDILRLSFKNSPEESRRLIKEIIKHDEKVVGLFKQLILEDSDYNRLIDEINKVRVSNNQPWMETYALAHFGAPTEYERLRKKEKEYSEERSKLNDEISKLKEFERIKEEWAQTPSP